MILTDLTLKQFRSYSKRLIEFSPGITVFIGPNTVGKTNILEALMVMATGKSFRADRDLEMIRLGEEVGRILVRGAASEEEVKLEMLLTTGVVGGQKAPMKKYLVNGIARRQIDFVGNLRAVLFWPEHLELVTDSPGIRRKYLDSVLVQVDREYRRNLMSYERGVRQRNKLLFLIHEGKAMRSQLLFWNQLLIRAGSYLTDARASYIEYINSTQLASMNCHIVYDKSVISESRLDQYKDEEVAAKVTLVGPHRDDFVMTKKNNKDFIDLSKYGSRGEQRLAVLWMKLAELSFIEKKTGDRPMLLLDDIFSELDEGHRGQVLDLIQQQQTVITSAEEEVVQLLKKKKIESHVIHLVPATRS